MPTRIEPAVCCDTHSCSSVYLRSSGVTYLSPSQRRWSSGSLDGPPTQRGACLRNVEQSGPDEEDRAPDGEGVGDRSGDRGRRRGALGEQQQGKRVHEREGGGLAHVG